MLAGARPAQWPKRNTRLTIVAVGSTVVYVRPFDAQLVRLTYELNGSTLEDICYTCCCPSCAAVQLYNEAKQRGPVRADGSKCGTNLLSSPLPPVATTAFIGARNVALLLLTPRQWETSYAFDQRARDAGVSAGVFSPALTDQNFNRFFCASWLCFSVSAVNGAAGALAEAGLRRRAFGFKPFGPTVRICFSVKRTAGPTCGR